jgi:hypothetical protein
MDIILIKIASIYKVGLFLVSLYVLSFTIVSLIDFFRFIKSKLNDKNR